MMNVTQVFVYGTLKPGEINYRRYCEPDVIQVQPAIAYGQLFRLPMGYPAMTVGEGVVQGVILSFPNPSILQVLDRLEDYNPQRPTDQNEYQRQQIPTYTLDHQPLEQVWAYLMEVEQIQDFRGTVPIPSRCWSQPYG